MIFNEWWTRYGSACVGMETMQEVARLAYEEGVKAGFDTGYDEGYSNGYDTGSNDEREVHFG